MATPRVTIDQLPEQTVPEDTNYFVVQDDGVSKKLSYLTLKNQPSAALTAHINNATGAHAATAVSATDSANGINGTTVQAQLGQLSTLAAGKINQTVADGLYINITGDAMTGPLVVTAPTLDMHAATKKYVDDAVIASGGGITQAQGDLRYVNVDGDTMTGALAVQALLSTTVGVDLPAGEPTAVQRAARKDYVDTQVATRLTQAQVDARVTAVGDPVYANIAGDTMTGNLQLMSPQQTAVASATRKDYVDAQVATKLDQATADGRYVNITGDTMTGQLDATRFLGGVDPTGVGSGVWVVGDLGYVVSTVAANAQAGNANMDLRRRGSGAGTPGQVNGLFARFTRSASVSTPTDTQIGSITIGSDVASVLYNTTSDRRLKTLVAPYEASDVIDRLEPVTFTWSDNPDAGEQVGFFAQDVHEVVPMAVAVGTGEPGDEDFIPWGMDNSKLVPYLVAELKALKARIAQLEGAAA